MPQYDVYGYTLRDDNNKIVYVGTTGHPKNRSLQHRQEGKRFKRLQVETKLMS